MRFPITPDNRMIRAIDGFSKHNAPLKIVVKARDELELTKSWIEHHAGIVGLENLLIADNASNISEVFEIYESFGPSLNWFTFFGDHENIQRESKFPGIYAALASSCKYAMSIDMDERLLGFTDTTWCADSRILNRLRGTSAALISAPWLQNTPGRNDQFELYQEQLEWGVIFGKPLIATNNPCIGTGRIHTVHYSDNDIDFLGFGVLHLSQFSVTQRLRTNRNKLIQCGAVGAGTSYEEIAAMRVDTDLPKPLLSARCIEEIQRLMLHNNEGSDIPAGNIPSERSVDLAPDGQLVFGSPSAQSLFGDFIRCEKSLSMKMLSKGTKLLS